MTDSGVLARCTKLTLLIFSPLVPVHIHQAGLQRSSLHAGVTLQPGHYPGYWWAFTKTLLYARHCGYDGWREIRSQFRGPILEEHTFVSLLQMKKQRFGVVKVFA